MIVWVDTDETRTMIAPSARPMPIAVSVGTSVLQRLGELRYSVRADLVDPRLRLTFTTDTLDIRLADGSRMYLHPEYGSTRPQHPIRRYSGPRVSRNRRRRFAPVIPLVTNNTAINTAAMPNAIRPGRAPPPDRAQKNGIAMP